MDALCIFLLSGPLAVGKTAVRLALVSQHAFAYLRSSEYLRALAAATEQPQHVVLLCALEDVTLLAFHRQIPHEMLQSPSVSVRAGTRNDFGHIVECWRMVRTPAPERGTN